MFKKNETKKKKKIKKKKKRLTKNQLKATHMKRRIITRGKRQSRKKLQLWTFRYDWNGDISFVRRGTPSTAV